jgi:hypothetical protein
MQMKMLVISKQRMSEMWRNPFYCGISTHRMLDGKVVKGKWEKLISEKDFLKVQEILEGNNFGYKQDKSNSNRPLSGFIFCSQCGKKMTGYEVKSKHVHYYKCQFCKGISINANKTVKSINEGANDLFFDFLSGFSLNSSLKGNFKEILSETFKNMQQELFSDVPFYKKELQKCENELKLIIKNKILGLVDDEEIYNELKSDLETKIYEIKDNLAKSKNKISNLDVFINKSFEIAENLHKYWGKADVGLKKKIQELVFPEGVLIDTKKRQYLTKKVNSVFVVNSLLSSNCNHKKENDSSGKLESSYLVARTGLEPVTFGL